MRFASPNGRASGCQAELPSSGCCQSRPLRVLCVDDDDRVRAALMDMLGADGHIVVGAPGGRGGGYSSFATNYFTACRSISSSPT